MKSIKNIGGINIMDKTMTLITLKDVVLHYIPIIIVIIICYITYKVNKKLSEYSAQIQNDYNLLKDVINDLYIIIENTNKGLLDCETYHLEFFRIMKKYIPLFQTYKGKKRFCEILLDCTYLTDFSNINSSDLETYIKDAFTRSGVSRVMDSDFFKLFLKTFYKGRMNIIQNQNMQS